MGKDWGLGRESHNKGLNRGMVGPIHSLGLERERNTHAFVPDVNKTKQNETKNPPNLPLQLGPRTCRPVTTRIGVLGHWEGWECKGEQKRHSWRSRPLGTFPALSSAAPGAAWPTPSEQAG